jgi:hypothetical protein
MEIFFEILIVLVSTIIDHVSIFFYCCPIKLANVNDALLGS